MRVIRHGPAILGDRLFRAFLRSLRLADLAEATRRGYAGDLRRFRCWIEETRGARAALGRLDTVDLINYRQHLIRSEKLRAASVNRKVQALKKFFAWAQQQKIVRSNPAAALRFLRRPATSQPKGLQPGEVQALLRAAGQTGHGLARRNYALLQVLLETGLRVGETARLTIADCEIKDRSGRVLVRAGKGSKEREIPLNASARRALSLYLKARPGIAGHDPLFLSERGGRAMSLRTMQATIQKLARQAKVNRLPVSAHTCRHSFAHSFLRRNPGKLVELAALLGHESLDTTAVYLRPSADALARAVEKGDDP
ncbi:MAG TPA: tyrosine-type recombinase/integrase [Terriglobia bacterium]|nr:tyrosine-type recombinase/integrase [Terriglobia bacterium]